MKLTDEFVESQLLKRNIKKLDTYTNNQTKMRLQCLKAECNCVWINTYNTIIAAGAGCPNCNHIILRVTNEIIDERLKDTKIKRVSDCVNGITPIMLQCLVNPNHTWSSIPNFNIRKNHVTKCPHCWGKKKLTNDVIDSRLEKLNIKRVDEYKNMETSIKLKCLIDGCEWEDKPILVLTRNISCPVCITEKEKQDAIFREQRKNVKKGINPNTLTNEKVDERLKRSNIQRIGNYVNNITKIEFKCLKEGCGHTWKTTPNIIINKTHGKRPSRCPKCSNHIIITDDIIDQRLKNRPIKRIGTFINGSTKSTFLCLNPKCNNIWDTTPARLFNAKVGCPKCCYLKSERMVENIIKDYVKYDYFEAHRKFYFNNKNYVPDFYLEINNKKIIIEYNGQQHYMPVRFNGRSIEKAITVYEKQVKRDNDLKKYCQENDIYILEIPYTLKKEKITEEISKLSLKYNDIEVFNV